MSITSTLSGTPVEPVPVPAVLDESEMGGSDHQRSQSSSSSSASRLSATSSTTSEPAMFLTSTKASPPFSVDEVPSREGIKHMTADVILQQCLQHQGYRTPELNEKLYLHHFGFPTITKHISRYRSCRVLYLSHNAISDLSPLASLVKLDSLFISHNTLTSLETLPFLPKLRLLDVSHNTIRELCTETPQETLETLLASHNSVKNLDGICLSFPALTSLDIAYNQVPRLEMVEQALAEMSTTLATLVLQGNPAQRCASKSNSHYRKRMIHFFRSLRFLDEYPVFAEERRVAEAFTTGGREGEVQMKKQIKAEEKVMQNEQFRYFEEERNAVRAHRSSCGRVVGNTQYFEDNRIADDVYIPCSTSFV